MSHKGFRKEGVLQECPTKVSPTRVSNIAWVFGFKYVFAFGFVGQFFILLFFPPPRELHLPCLTYHTRKRCGPVVEFVRIEGVCGLGGWGMGGGANEDKMMLAVGDGDLI